MKKRLFASVLAIALLFSLASCGNGSGESYSGKDSPLTEKEIEELYAMPEEFKGRSVEILGVVFSEPERDGDRIYFQMWADPINCEKNTVVSCSDSDLKLHDGDYVKIVGTIGKPFEGETLLGEQITAPTIFADSVEVVTYQEAVAPAIATYEFSDLSQTQFGYTVSIQKVELAETETRVYVNVQNQGSAAFSLYSFDCKIVQDGKQHNEESNFDADYPEIQSDLQVGASTDGIICFDPINNSDFKIVFEAGSDNWDETINPYTFDVVLNQ